jgi:hypothetical protein
LKVPVRRAEEKMGLINLDDVEIGMVLAADVKESSGAVLLAAGGVITEKCLNIFKKWGITEVDVQGVSREAVTTRVYEQVDPILRKETETHVAGLFCHNDPLNPVIQELMRICNLRLLQHRSGGRP